METDSGLRTESTPQGVAVFLDGRRLSSARPRSGTRRRLPGTPLSRTGYVGFSPLQGYGLRDLRSRLDPASFVLTLELEERLNAVAHSGDSELILDDTPGSERCHFCTGLDSDPVQALRRRVSLEARRRGVRRLEFLRLSGGVDLHRDGYDEAARLLQEDLADVWRNRATEIVLGRRWLANTFSNGALAHRSADALDELIQERVVMVGAGPSLDDALPTIAATLRSAGRRDLSIVALDTALPVLAEHGIVPDVVVAMDCQIFNVYDLMPWRWDDTALLTDITCHPAVVRKFPPHRRYFFLSEFAPIALVRDAESLRRFPVIPPLGSVAGAAAFLLDATGRRTGRPRSVVTVGIDFATVVGATHGRMAPAHRLALANASRTTPVGVPPRSREAPAVSSRSGGHVATDAVLSRQAESLRRVITTSTISWYALGDGVDFGARPLPAFTAPSTPDTTIDGRRGGAGDGKGDTGPGRIDRVMRHLVEEVRAELIAAETPLRTDGSGDPRDVMSERLWELVTLDFPDMARLWTDRHFRIAQRGRILGSLLDLRRRVVRALECPGATSTGRS